MCAVITFLIWQAVAGFTYDECYREINLARGLHAQHDRVDELLSTPTPHTVHFSPLYALSAECTI